MDPDPATRPRFLRLTLARIGDTLHDGNGTRVAIVNAFTTVNPDTEAIVRAVDYQVVGAADVELRRNARSAAVKDGEVVETPPHPARRPRGEVARRGRDWNPACTSPAWPFVYEASFPLPAGKAGGAAGAAALPEGLRDYRPDFYLPDPEAPVTAASGVWLEHHAHDRSGRAPAEFASLRGGAGAPDGRRCALWSPTS